MWPIILCLCAASFISGFVFCAWLIPLQDPPNDHPKPNEARDFDDWWREHKRLLLVSEPASLGMVRFVAESKSRDAWQAALQSNLRFLFDEIPEGKWLNFSCKVKRDGSSYEIADRQCFDGLSEQVQRLVDALIPTRVTIKFPAHLMNEPSEKYPNISATTAFSRDTFEQFRRAGVRPLWISEPAPIESNPHITRFVGIEIDTHPNAVDALAKFQTKEGA